MIGRSKLLIPFFVIGTVIIATAFLVSSADGASIDEDVHGISYKDNSILKLGVFPGANTAYQNIDWYITAHGTVEIHQDGELKETLAVDGLYVLKSTYEPGTRYNVSIQINGTSTYNFTLNVRSVIGSEEIDPDVPKEDLVSMTGLQLTLEQIKMLVIGSIAAACAIGIAYKHRRDSNRRGWHF